MITADTRITFEESAHPTDMLIPKFRPETQCAIELTEYLTYGRGSPFTEEEQKVFDLARRTENAATRILKGFTIPGVVLAGGGSLLQLTGLISLAHPSLAQATLVGSAIGGFFLGALGGGLVYVSTGFLPHWASNTANPAQNVLETARDTFAATVRDLGDLYYSDDNDSSTQVETLVTKMDINQLEIRAVEYSGQDEAGDILNPFRIIKKHITHTPEYLPDHRGIGTHLRLAAMEQRERLRGE